MTSTSTDLRGPVTDTRLDVADSDAGPTSTVRARGAGA